MPESYTNPGNFGGGVLFQGSPPSDAGQIAGTIINNENPEILKLLVQVATEKGAFEERRRVAEAKAEEFATKLGFTSAAVIEFFRILGEQHVPEEKLKDRLVEIATRFATTRDVLAALEPDDPRAAELVGQATDALDQGRLAEAEALLNQAKELEAAALREARKLRQRAQEAEDRHALNLAKIEAGQGEISLTLLHYSDAAEHFEQAAALVPAKHVEQRTRYLFQQARALYEYGNSRGDNAALRTAVAIYEAVLRQIPRERAPLDWAGRRTTSATRSGRRARRGGVRNKGGGSTGR